MSAFERITYEVRDRIAVVTIMRQESRNALDDHAIIEMGQAFDQFAADDDAWIAVITGQGDKSFCAGNDLKARAAGGVLQKEKWSGGFGGLASRHDLYKPVIAAVNGFAVGGGFELALACDIIIAAQHATFALPEVKFGQMAGAGGPHRLVRSIGWQRTMGIMLTGRPIDAATAYDWGIVNEVVPADDLMETAMIWAREIASNSPLAVRATKETAASGMHWPLSEVVDHSFPGRDRLRASGDFKEGPKAFSEKREPKWGGK